ncbi:helix-turn-helix transcriptional regulator [Ligilactobacillus agilis]|uniref:helix-turn-helix domain-containing protein n=1 Tax=Ligilactobacillus agilis TaxID=1601 RepID=UPI0019588E1C|nr:helix-turn-helix transcriptional regulator [Ligilactobacillus agilis]MBM6773483.1 helix-turn-helix transcriptional regulator [Ligilactobacillus agilis]
MLGNILKELRKQKRMTQKDLAQAMRVSQQTVGAWETERAIPGADTLNDLADYFNVTTDYLLGRPEKKEKKNVELTDDDVIMTYQGKELSDEDREIIKRLMNGK